MGPQALYDRADASRRMGHYGARAAIAPLAELAVETTGLGNVPDKITKNHRKTLGLMRDIADVADLRRHPRRRGHRASPKSPAPLG